MGTLCSTNRENDTLTKATIGFKKEYCGVTFENVSGDICNEVVDAIVSGANNRLAHNNGLANSIVVRGGAIIQEESDRIVDDNDGVCKTASTSVFTEICIVSAGTAVITSGGQLPSKYIIHVVSPVWTGGEKREVEKLGEAVVNALNRAVEIKAESIAVPSLSSGLFGFPKDLAAQTIISKTLEYIENRDQSCSLRLVKFVNLEAETVRCFKTALENTLKGRVDSNGASPKSVRTNAAEEQKDPADANGKFDLVLQEVDSPPLTESGPADKIFQLKVKDQISSDNKLLDDTNSVQVRILDDSDAEQVTSEGVSETR